MNYVSIGDFSGGQVVFVRMELWAGKGQNLLLPIAIGGKYVLPRFLWKPKLQKRVFGVFPFGRIEKTQN
jgi:hypothetical protein